MLLIENGRRPPERKHFRSILGYAARVIGLVSLAFAALLLLVVGAFLLLGEFRKHNPRPRLVDAQSSVSPEVLERMRKSTVDLEIAAGNGRGYRLPDSNVILTNAHVVKPWCFFGKCPKDGVSVQVYSSAAEVEGRSFDLVRCVQWLDLCALVPSGEKPRLGKNSGAAVKELGKDEAVFVLPSKHFHPEQVVTSKLIVGKIAERLGDAFVVTDIPSKPGYSGSPIFDVRGELVGIMASSPLTPSRFADPLFPLLRFFSGEKVVSPHSNLISRHALQRVLLCQEEEGRDCIREEISEYLAFLESIFAEGCPRWIDRIALAGAREQFVLEICGVRPSVHLTSASLGNLGQFCARTFSDEFLLADPFWWKTAFVLALEDGMEMNRERVALLARRAPQAESALAERWPKCL